jgi:hypothetical protein
MAATAVGAGEAVVTGGRRGRAGPPRRRADRSALVTGCRQCGRWQSVTVLRLGRRRVRYWCQHCGAVVGADPRVLRPAGELRAAATGPAATGPAAAPGPGDVMPAAMLAWVGTRSRKPVTLQRLDKAAIYHHYQQWDAHQSRAGRPDSRPPARSPAFPAVVGALHNLCYRGDLVAGSFLPPASPPGPATDAVWERVEHARCWLAVRGREWCWIHAGVPGSGPVVPDRADVAAAVAALGSGDDPQVELLWAALFGTDRGPALRKLRLVYQPEEMIDAMRVYLRSGARPLRDQVLAWLTTKLTGPGGRARRVGG